MRQSSLFPPVRTPFRPFPRLWEAFADEPDIIEILDHPPGGFSFLNEASRTFAMRGKDPAREFIKPAGG